MFKALYKVAFSSLDNQMENTTAQSTPSRTMAARKKTISKSLGRVFNVCYPALSSQTATRFVFTLFRADINQSEVEDSFQLASDWIKSARKNANKLKEVTLLGSLL